jgi:hypothetical protein
MKKLSKIQQYAIEHLLSKNTDEDTICNELKITKDLLTQYIEKNHRAKTENTQIATTSSKVTSKDMMIRSTRDKQNNTVAIMTKDASAYNDSFKKNIAPLKTDQSKHIHKIK